MRIYALPISEVKKSALVKEYETITAYSEESEQISEV